MEQLRILNEVTANMTEADMEYLKDNAQKPYDLRKVYGANKGDKIIFFPEEGVIELIVMLILFELARFLLRLVFS